MTPMKIAGLTVCERLLSPGGRNSIYRCSLGDGNGTVILKQVGGDLWRQKEAQRRLQSELRALKLLQGESLVPSVVAAYPEKGILLLEDLGNHVEPGCWDSDALMQMARALGQLARFQIEHTSSGFRRRFKDLKIVSQCLQKIGHKKGVELATTLERLATNKSRHLVLCHGDPVRSNVILIGGRAWLIDFEFSEPAPPLRDLAWFFMGMPTARDPYTISAEVLAAMRACYNEAGEDALSSNSDKNLLISGAFWLLLTLDTHLPGAVAQDVVWGTTSNRTRIITRIKLYADLVARTINDDDLLDMLTEAADRMELGWKWSISLPQVPLAPQTPSIINASAGHLGLPDNLAEPRAVGYNPRIFGS